MLGPTGAKTVAREATSQETGKSPPWGKLGLAAVALVLGGLLLGVDLSGFERLLLAVPPAIMFAALGIARVIEMETAEGLEEALGTIEHDREALQPDDPWSKEIHRLRADYLLDVRAHAERWRTIFGSLLAVFGAIVLVGRPQALSSAGQTPEPLILLTVVGLSAGLTAIAMAGWAAAGAPKIDWLKQTDPEALRRRMFEHANRSAARLRAALTCGVVAIVAVLAGTVIVLLGGRS